MYSLSDIPAIFSENGHLSPSRGFEFRPQQSAMASLIADALESGRHCMIEAPTGIGKTLAYFIPSIIFALENGRKAIISTNTKNLQEQILQNDIPIVRSILGLDFRVAILKGRSNYLCPTRLLTLLNGTIPISGEEQNDLAQLASWASTTVDGDVESLGFIPGNGIWERVCSEKHLCNSITCRAGCFFQRAKQRAREADILVVNHALFFSLFAISELEGGFLFKDDFVIFDEAHTVAAAVGNALTLRLSRARLMSVLRRLYDDKTRRGLLAQAPKSVRDSCRTLMKNAAPFFSSFSTFRSSGTTTLTGELVGQEFLASLNILIERLREYVASEVGESLRAEILSAQHFIEQTLNFTEDFLGRVNPAYVYWVEQSDGDPVLHAGPFDVSDYLREQVFARKGPVILTSATLALNKSLSYSASLIGAKNISFAILDSPFRSDQMSICIGEGMPDPRSPEYTEALGRWITRAISMSDGSALVLFTNASLMQMVAGAVSPAFEENGWRLLVQGVDGKRSEILQMFRHDIRSVLFGLNSFWTGVDVPGEALEHVIITRLPFTSPGHPLVEARLDSIKRSGGDPFQQHLLPEAILKFRQGVGRLIRSTTDRGMVTILDSRVSVKQYGKYFLEALPPCRTRILNTDGDVYELETDLW